MVDSPPVKHGQMDVEKCDVEHEGEEDQAHGSGQEVVQGVDL